MTQHEVRISGQSTNQMAHGAWHEEDGKYSTIVTLFSDKCPFCGKFVAGPKQYAQILEHEYIELTAITMAYESGIDVTKWNASGFNKAITFAIPKKKVVHKCSCDCGANRTRTLTFC